MCRVIDGRVAAVNDPTYPLSRPLSDTLEEGSGHSQAPVTGLDRHITRRTEIAMSIALHSSAHVILDRIVTLAKHDVDFRLALTDVLESLSAIAVAVDETPVDEAASPVETMLGPPDDLAQPLVSEDESCDSASSPAIQIRSRQPREPIQTDLAAIEARCRLKAEGARWAAERQHRMQNGASFTTAIVPHDRELIDRARQSDCFLWMCSRSSPQPSDLGLFDVLGSCFDVAADAAALLRECAFEVGNDELLSQCLNVAAEAQSALRSAVMAVDTVTDIDQQSLFGWLRRTAREEGVFIERHVRADDPADPYRAADIQGRIQAIRTACQAVIDRQSQRTRRLNRLRYHAKLIHENGNSDHDWSIVAQVTDEMVRDGVPPSNREIRDAVLPIIDAVPGLDTFPPAFLLVLREAEAYRATRNVISPEPTTTEPTAAVLAVRKYLRGKTIVIVGGDPDSRKQQAIKDAFELSDLVWVESRHHQSIERFKPAILRPDVAMVVLVVRWASHSYADLKPLCAEHGRLFVRLPGGYNPNQVASQIMAQCGYLLNRESSTT